MNKHIQELQQFAEALLDLDRLKIVGELAQGRTTPTEIANRTGIERSTVEAHLQVLAGTKVIDLETGPDGHPTYRLDSKALEEMSKRQFQWAKRTAAEPDRRRIGEGFTKIEAKYIRSFTDPNGLIRHLPSIREDDKLQAVLKYARQDLQTGRIYSEKEFNEALRPFTRDPSSVRRYLVDYLYVDREIDGSAYWLRESGDD
jgi:hypothetical protein